MVDNSMNIPAGVEWEVRQLMEKIQFDYETSLDIIQTFVVQTLHGLRDIQEGLMEENMERVSVKLHQLKGSAGAAQIERLRILFERAEVFARNGKVQELKDCLAIIMEDELFSNRSNT